MPNLTADQLSTISDSLVSIAEAINDYLDAPPILLSPDQIKAFKAQRDQIENNAQAIDNMALTIDLDQGEALVTRLNAGTERINADIKHLTDIQKVINLAGSAVTLAVAIIEVETNPGGVVGAIGGVIGAVEAITSPGS